MPPKLRILLALPLVAPLRAAQAGVCAESFPPLAEGGVCGDYLEAGVEVCACPVTTGELACGSPSETALLAVNRNQGDEGDYGTWPPESAGITSEAALREFATQVGASAELDLHCDGLAVDASSLETWDDLDVVFSPEGDMLAVGRRAEAGLLDTVNDISLVRCDEGGAGWSIERMLPATVWLARWGAGNSAERTLYFASQSLHRLALDREASEVETAGGEPVTALVARRLELLARKPDHDDSGAEMNTADMDVAFPEGEDRYMMFLEGELDGADVLSRILISDLRTCDFEQCAAQDWDYCCKTALLAEYGPLTPNWYTITAITNPAMNHDGSLISFHWDSLALAYVDENYSILYLAQNPMLDEGFESSCDEQGAVPGFSDALDCRGIYGDDGYGRPDCPNYHHCGDAGVDCGLCVAIGGNDPDGQADDGHAVRNLTSFFHLDGAEYVALERWTFGRDGSGGESMAWLDVYAIPQTGLQLPADDQGFPIVFETATDAVDWSAWHPSAIRRLAADEGGDDSGSAGDDSGSAGDDSGSAEDDSGSGDQDSAEPGDSGRGGGEGCGGALGCAQAGLAGWLPLMLVSVWRRRRRAGGSGR